MAGVRFCGDELLQRLPPDGAGLIPAVGTLAARLSARGPETQATIIECERILVAVGRAPPRRPHGAVEYRAWAKVIAGAGHDLYPEKSAESGAFIIGATLGDLLLTLELEAQVEELRRVAPNQPFLLRHATALDEDRERARSALVAVSRRPGLPPAATAILTHALTAPLEELLELAGDLEVALEPVLPYPESLCHRCAAPPRYIVTETSTFILCPILPNKYPRQPVLSCTAFRART